MGDEESNKEVNEAVKESPKKPARAERKLSTEEEIAMVRKMSNEDAWSHVMTQVFEEKKQTERNVKSTKTTSEQTKLSFSEVKQDSKKESSEDAMKRMSENIDISNQKVLETIQFLSKDSTVEDSSSLDIPDDLLNEAEELINQVQDLVSEEKDNTSKNLHEVTDEFAKNLASEAIEDAKLVYAVSQQPDICRKV